jgi:hypothetical protein
MTDMSSGDWFEPRTYSVWVFKDPSSDEETDPAPIVLFVLFEWEIAGLRGVELRKIYGSLSDLLRPEEERDTEYRSLSKELAMPEWFQGVRLAELIDQGHLQRLGSMPQWGEFSTLPEELLPLAQRKSATPPAATAVGDRPVDSQP